MVVSCNLASLIATRRGAICSPQSSVSCASSASAAPCDRSHSSETPKCFRWSAPRNGVWRPTHSPQSGLPPASWQLSRGYFPVNGNTANAPCLWKLADRTKALLSMLLLSPQMMPRSRPSSAFAVAQFRVGSLSQAAKLFCAGARNCRIRCIASRHVSPAALLDDRSPVP
jgi:hypothetical protein